jgi:hypothetical protein
MAASLSKAVLNRRTSIVGSPLQNWSTDGRRQRMHSLSSIPFVHLKLYEQSTTGEAASTENSGKSKKNSRRAYFIESDMDSYKKLISSLHALHIPNGRPKGRAYSDRALIVRTAIYHNPQFKECLEHFIQILSGALQRIGKGQNLAEGCQLGKIQYIILFSKIYRALVNDRLSRFDVRLREEVQRDYLADCVLPVRRLIFNLADLWTTETTPLAYCTFLNDLLNQILNVKSLTFYADERIRCNPKIYCSTLNWTQGYKTLKGESIEKDRNQHVNQNVSSKSVKVDEQCKTKQNQRNKSTVRLQLDLPQPKSSDIENYIQRFELNEDSYLRDGIETGTSFPMINSISAKSLQLPLTLSNTTTSKPSAPTPSATLPTSMQMITGEHPIGMLNSIGLRARTFSKVANEQFEIPVGTVLTRRVKTDVKVAIANRTGNLFLK